MGRCLINEEMNKTYKLIQINDVNPTDLRERNNLNIKNINN